MGNVHVIPQAIQNIMAQGYRRHIPLNLLTDAYCRNYSAHDALTTSTATFGDGGLQFKVTGGLPDKGESTITITEWNQAFVRLLSLMTEYMPELREPWTMHYDRIRLHEGLEDEWPYWREYDIRIRKRALREPLDPTEFHPEIYLRCRMEVDRQRMDATQNQALNALQDRVQEHLTGGRSRMASPYNTPHRPKRSLEAAEMWTPNPKRTPFRFRGESERHPAAFPSLKCIVCGFTKPQHGGWKWCDAKTNTLGKTPFMARNQIGKFVRATDGGRICYNFNGPVGCPFKSCNHGEHTCSICGQDGHAAQACRDC